jgi:hypothetical protein
MCTVLKYKTGAVRRDDKRFQRDELIESVFANRFAHRAQYGEPTSFAASGPCPAVEGKGDEGAALFDFRLFDPSET